MCRKDERSSFPRSDLQKVGNPRCFLFEIMHPYRSVVVEPICRKTPCARHIPLPHLAPLLAERRSAGCGGRHGPVQACLELFNADAPVWKNMTAPGQFGFPRRCRCQVVPLYRPPNIQGMQLTAVSASSFFREARRCRLVKPHKGVVVLEGSNDWPRYSKRSRSRRLNQGSCPSF